jgi:hypothetical protein
MGSDIEVLTVGRCVLRKNEQRPELRIDYRDEFEPD